MFLLVIGILVGAVLSLRFNFFMLIPVTCSALVIAAVDGTASGGGFWYIVSKMALVVIALQLGYLAGSVFALIFSSSRTSRRPEPISTKMSGTF
jgi:hypothetical protein